MVFKNLCVLVLWKKVASALEGLMLCGSSFQELCLYNTQFFLQATATSNVVRHMLN